MNFYSGFYYTVKKKIHEVWPSKGKYSRIMHCRKKYLRTKSSCADDIWIDIAKLQGIGGFVFEPLAGLNKHISKKHRQKKNMNDSPDKQ